MSFGIGAYGVVELDLDDRARAALVELLRFTLPTFTPAIRTSASSASVAASGMCTLNR